MRRAREQIPTFVAFPGTVEVTNGYRAMWAAKGEADMRTVVATAALTSKATPFATLAA